jgi:tetratricopeptide (TPR) repeat protein
MMDCGLVRTANVAELYLLGRLDGPERDAFEDHLVACGDCCGELADLCALREELERSRGRIVAEAAGPSQPSRRTWLLAAAAAAVAVAVGLGLWVRLQPSPAPEPVLAELGPVAQPESVPAAGPDLAGLAAFEAPPYAPLRLRGSEDDAARRFAEAMELYTRGEWQAALPGLRSAAALDPEAPHLSFYLGACALLSGETDEAIATLERTQALGDTPFLEEAGFLLAKAYLRVGDLRSARHELVEVVALDGDRLGEAQALLGRLDTSGEPSR